MYSSFATMMPQTVREFVRVDHPASRKARIALVGRLLQSYTLGDIAIGLTQVSPIDERSAAALEHALYAMTHPEFHPEPFAEEHTPTSLHGQLPQLEAYDRLVGGAMS